MSDGPSGFGRGVGAAEARLSDFADGSESDIGRESYSQASRVEMHREGSSHRICTLIERFVPPAVDELPVLTEKVRRPISRPSTVSTTTRQSPGRQFCLYA